MLKLSIVIPVYNAEKTIESLCTTLIDLYGQQFSLEIVLANDNSQDSSHLICSRLHRTHPETITYLRLARNFGEHNAVMAGLNHATGDLCVIMDDDFQNPPEEVARLIEQIDKGYDVVYSQYPVKRDSLFRNLGSRINNKMATVLLHKPADLYLSSFKVINRFMLEEIIKYTGSDPYLDAIILRSTANIGTIEVRHDRRRHGHTGYSLGKLVSLWGNMVVSYSLVPLRFFGIVGSVMTIVGILVGGVTLWEYTMFPHDDKPTDIEKLTAATLFFRGFNLFAISVVGEYVGRIYLALVRDPQFVIRERLIARNRTVIAEVSKRKEQPAREDHAL